MIAGKYFLLLVLMFPALDLAGQGCVERLQGRIVNELGESLPHAAVRVENTQIHAISDAEGRFSLSGLCPGEIVFTITYIGYAPQSVAVQIPTAEEALITLVPSETLLDNVVVEGSTPGVTQTQAFLEDEELKNLHGKPLGESLKEIPGVSALQTGPAIFKPVIDGLHSQRILILNNGIRQEGQQWGVEHAPEIDPFIASSITVVRGAEAVRYGAAAMGGAIIINPPPLHETEKTGGEINVGLMSNNRMAVVSAMVEGTTAPESAWSWRLQSSGKRGGDYHAPRYNLSNTGLSEYNFSGAIGYEDDRRALEVYASSFNTEIGILRAAHTGNLSDFQRSIDTGRPWYAEDFMYEINHPKQRTNHHLLKVSGHHHIEKLGKVTVLYGGQYDLRQEYDIRRADRAGRPSVSLHLISHVLDVSLDHRRDAHTGSLGVNATIKDNTNDTEETGVRPLLPDYRQVSGGVFFHEKFHRNAWTLEAGARYDHQYLQVLTFANRQLVTPEFRFNTLSGSLGAAFRFNPRVRLVSNFGISSRPPHVSELYSEGLHHGTASIEEGLMRRAGQTLTNQSAVDMEVSKKWISTLQYAGTRLSVDLSAYYIDFNNYVYMRPVGTRLTVRGHFPVFQYEQTDALLAGTDLALNWDMTEVLSLNQKFSFLYARDKDHDDVLLSIPPAQWETGVTWRREAVGRLHDFYVTLSLPVTFRQHRAPGVVRPDDIDHSTPEGNFDFAPAPEAYALMNARIGGKIPVGDHTLGVTLSAENLLNQSYRNYMNRLRYFADEVGANFILRVSYNFLSH